MFTGIIQEVGKIESIKFHGSSAWLSIHAPMICQDAQLGDSICSNGVCLTVAQLSSPYFWADLSSETLNRSTLINAKVGDEVNLEPSLRPTDRMGGHIVNGHVDGVGYIESLTEDGESWKLVVHYPDTIARFIAEKGSLSVDGISLTVTDTDNERAGFAIVPFTIEHTNLRSKGSGDPVNLEVDVIARYIERLLTSPAEGRSTGLSWDKLRQYGYINE